MGNKRPVGIGVDDGPATGGPLCVAGVYVNESVVTAWQDKGIKDSKLLTALARERLYEEIVSTARAWGAGIAEAAEIDACNVLEATRRAMKRAVEAMTVRPDYLIVDAVPLPGLGIEHEHPIKADRHVLSVAAASIVAKVTRDRMLIVLDAEYAGHGFSVHKGYGTRSISGRSARAVRAAPEELRDDRAASCSPSTDAALAALAPPGRRAPGGALKHDMAINDGSSRRRRSWSGREGPGRGHRVRASSRTSQRPQHDQPPRRSAREVGKTARRSSQPRCAPVHGGRFFLRIAIYKKILKLDPAVSTRACVSPISTRGATPWKRGRPSPSPKSWCATAGRRAHGSTRSCPHGAGQRHGPDRPQHLLLGGTTRPGNSSLAAAIWRPRPGRHGRAPPHPGDRPGRGGARGRRAASRARARTGGHRRGTPCAFPDDQLRRKRWWRR
jgi:ribonuclease HII